MQSRNSLASAPSLVAPTGCASRKMIRVIDQRQRLAKENGQTSENRKYHKESRKCGAV